MGDPVQLDVREYTDDSGCQVVYERYRRQVPVSAFEHGERFKDLCEGCPKHGNSLSCPPHSPSFVDHIEGAGKAMVVCIRLAQKHFGSLPPQERYHACFRRATRLLLEELRGYRDEGRPVAGSGPCLACDRCCLEEGLDACRSPDERTFSLESLGVNVIALLKTTFNIDLEWNTAEKNSEFVSAVGAAFLP
jgi:predicted metal-binding protein